MTQEQRQEIEDEMKEEHHQLRRLEDSLEYCLEHNADLIDEIKKAENKLLFTLAKYGHDLSRKDLENWI